MPTAYTLLLKPLSDVVPLTSYTFTFDGSGGVAGFGKGQASVVLSGPPEGATQLSYTAQAQVGGKIAQVGARLIDGVARKLADEFFSRFKTALEPASQEAPTEAVEEDAEQSGQPPTASPAWKFWRS
ncbi:MULTISPECIES: CoxG family protein [unclassified Pigmentiphaga]|uniref:Carbon monoxide dehydrogenase subunit G n=1 Tax=Pigmentiphaga daeguensis TaxID=414049 RepID=A0ABP3N2C5_9BURK|nr:hypothetical protein CDO46_10875 [Pigmentiphaga sp. NML030171]